MEDRHKQKVVIAFACIIIGLAAVFLLVWSLGYRKALDTIMSGFPADEEPQVSRDIRSSTDESPLPAANKAVQSQQAPVYFATMTHLESNWTQATTSKAFFDRHAAYLRTAYDYAQQYDAILTIETETPMAEAMLLWGENLLQEALDRGQGVGTHCDIPPKRFVTPEKMTIEFAKRKKAVDALVDPSQNLGCSGGGGFSNWYEGAVNAGFKYLDGIVGYHYLAVAVSERPQGWDDEAILEKYFHYGVPIEEEKRFYPFSISQVGFEPDAQGDLVISAGDIGTIQSIAELDGEQGWEGDCEGPCEFDREDVDVLVKRITSVVASADTSRLMKLQVYIADQYFADPDIEYFFQEMQKLQKDGVIQWASQKQVYEALTSS